MRCRADRNRQLRFVPQILPRLRKKAQKVGRDHRFLTDFFGGEIAGQAVEDKLPGKSDPRNFQDAPAPEFPRSCRSEYLRSRRRHSGIARGIDVDRLIGSCNNRSKAFQDDVHVVVYREIPSNVDSIRHHIIDVFSNQPRHLAGMRCKDDIPSFALDLFVKTDKGIQSIRIDNNRNRAFLNRSGERRHWSRER